MSEGMKERRKENDSNSDRMKRRKGKEKKRE